MKYTEVKIHVSRQGIEPVSTILMKNGISGIAVQDPSDIDEIMEKKNEYDWDYIDESVLEIRDEEPLVSFYLEISPENDSLLQHIKEEIMKLKNDELCGEFGADANLGRLYLEADVVDDADWKDKWKEYFKPARLTDKLVVKPTWESYEKNDGELVIELDPGMAFGTGTHETTSLCLRLLEKYGAEGKRILDAGSGSGILSIAAALLGAKEVMAVDIDPVAVQVGKENVEQNNLSDVITVEQGDLTKGINYKADVILANIMADIIKLISKDVPAHLADGGIYISSGILVERREDVVNTIQACGFRILEVLEDGEWCAVAADMGK